MLLRQRDSGHFVEIFDIEMLANPFCSQLEGRLHWGEEVGDLERFSKQSLCFASGEALPRCWLDQHYRDQEVHKHHAAIGREAS